MNFFRRALYSVCMELRLSKLMSERGICSRREADSFIEKGQVLVDDDVVSELGTKVSRDVTIKLLEAAKAQQMQKVTILLNKPIGFVSTQPEKGYLPAIPETLFILATMP